MTLVSLSYQTTILISCMVALFKQSKKSLRGFPSFPILPRMMPKAMQKVNKPKILIPSEVPGIGTMSSIGVQIMQLRINCILIK